jgi:hypothetical protein
VRAERPTHFRARGTRFFRDVWPQAIDSNGGRDRTRTCDLLRVKENHPLRGLHRFSPVSNIYNNLGICASLERNPNGLTRLSWSQL